MAALFTHPKGWGLPPSKYQGTSLFKVVSDIQTNLLENTKFTLFTYSWYSNNFIS